MLQEIMTEWEARATGATWSAGYKLYRSGKYVATFYTRQGVQLFVDYHGPDNVIRWSDEPAPAIDAPLPESVMSEQAVHYAPDA